MELSPARQRETFTSLQLQRASDQLQEAIQSARQRRSMYSSHATSLSLLSELSEYDDHDDDNDDDDDDDFDNQTEHDLENRFAAANMLGPNKRLADANKATPEQKLRQFMRESMGSTGRRSDASLTLKDLLESPLRPPRERTNESILKLLESVENVAASVATPPCDGLPMAKATKQLVDGDALAEQQARKALDLVQQEVEAQARANRTTQHELKRAVDRISAVIESFAGHNVGDSSAESESLSVESVKRLSDKWVESLEQWKWEWERSQQEMEEKWRQQEVDTEERIRGLEQVCWQEREILQAQLESMASEAADWMRKVQFLEESHSRLMGNQDAASRTSQQRVDRLRMENEDLAARLVQHVCAPEVIGASAEQQQRHVLDLLAQLKEAELRELQWEMLFQDQGQAARQTQARLDMLLEDVIHSEETRSLPASSMSTYAPTALSSPRARRVSMASSTASSELQFNQQRIGFLEDQLRDAKEQIQCDHQQFLYEQQKWELEKKHMSHGVEEVHIVSVKVLKMLLLREKLLKKQEKRLQKRLDTLTQDELLMREKQVALTECVDASMQECGAALLYVRQLAMADAAQQLSAPLPVKPIKLVRLVKRLKTLQQDTASFVRTSSKRQ